LQNAFFLCIVFLLKHFFLRRDYFASKVLRMSFGCNANG